MSEKRGEPVTAASPEFKRLKASHECSEDAYGFVTDDVASSVDWCSLTTGLKTLTASKFWALDITSKAVVDNIKLRASNGSRVPLAAAVRGTDVEQTGCGNFGAQEKTPFEPSFILSSGISLHKAAGKGRGWFTTRSLPAGTVVLVERPVVSILDAEWRSEDWSRRGSADTAALGIQLARCFSPNMAGVLAPLHPHEGADLPDMPDDSGDEDDESEAEPLESAALSAAVETAWAQVEGVSNQAKERLRALVRLNSLGFYTNSEQLFHQGNFSALTGSGIFALGSGFNHSCDPTVGRFSLGDVTIFVTNRPVEASVELCISYIEAELLCAPTSLRRQSLNRDFECTCPKCAANDVADKGGKSAVAPDGRPCYFRVDAQLQAELAQLPAELRLDVAEAALRGELPNEGDEEEEEEEGEKEEAEGNMGAGNYGTASASSSASHQVATLACAAPVEAPRGSTVLLGKDAQELRVVQAMAYMELQRYDEAIALWRRLAAFACHHCPPFDEGVVVFATQAALCALASCDGSSSDESAVVYVHIAASVHRVVSGDASLFKHRFFTEVEASLVPVEVKNRFWALVDERQIAVMTWGDAVAEWKFAANEIPDACMEVPPRGGGGCTESGSAIVAKQTET